MPFLYFKAWFNYNYGVYENLNDKSIRPKLREKLENDKENAYLSYEIATIYKEVPFNINMEDLLYHYIYTYQTQKNKQHSRIAYNFPFIL